MKSNLLIDFSNDKKHVLKHGFIKGLSSPLMLFGRFNAPEIPMIKPIIVPGESVKQSLSRDWIQIGADLKKVIKRHEQEARATKA